MRGQRHAPAAPYPRERPGTHCTGGNCNEEERRKSGKNKSKAEVTSVLGSGLVGNMIIKNWISAYLTSMFTIPYRYTIKCGEVFAVVKVKQSRYRPGVAQRVPGS